MRVLVTGSSGYLGGALLGALKARSHQPVRLVRGEPGSRLDEIGWDPSSGRLDPASIEAFEAVVHLAGVNIGGRRWSEKHKKAVLESRTQSTRLLSETLASLQEPPRVLVSASAIGYYGDRGGEELTEESAPGDDFMAGVCRQWEGETEPAAAAGVRVVNSRSGLVLDPKGGILARQLIPFKLGAGGRIGDGRQWWSWVTLRDWTGAVLHSLGNERLSGPVNVTAPNPVTNAEFTAVVGRVLRRPTFFTVPAGALRIALGAEMAEGLLLVSQRVLPRKLLASNYEFGDLYLEPALRAMLGNGGVARRKT